MHISKHAKIRCQQRGFRRDYLDFIINNGSAESKPGGVVEYRLRNKDKARIQSQLKRQLQSLDKLSKKAVIVSYATGEVVTAYNLTR